jgi:hypothetical protein
MRRSLCILASLACLLARAEGIDLSVKRKAIASEIAARSEAPFVAAREAWPLAIAPGAPPAQGPQGACERSAHDLCYDSDGRRIVYRPARAIMPRIGELTPEGVSVRRDRIVLRYSF